MSIENFNWPTFYGFLVGFVVAVDILYLSTLAKVYIQAAAVQIKSGGTVNNAKSTESLSSGKGLERNSIEYSTMPAVNASATTPGCAPLIKKKHARVTAAKCIDKETEDLIALYTGGLVKVARSGKKRAHVPASPHQWEASRGTGNFRMKARLESIHGGLHNDFADLPGQLGMNPDYEPEGNVGLGRRVDDLLVLAQQSPPGIAELVRMPMLTWVQFRWVADYRYARYNARLDHALEGWDMNHVYDPRTGGTRPLAPSEVWEKGRGELVKADPRLVAGILWNGNHGRELTVAKGQLVAEDKLITGDKMRFAAFEAGLEDGKKYACVVNPFDDSGIWVFDKGGVFLARAERIHPAPRGDEKATLAQMGKVNAQFAERMKPIRARHNAGAKQLERDTEYNMALATGDTPEQRRLQRKFGDRAGALLDDCTEAVIDVPDALDEDETISNQQ